MQIVRRLLCSLTVVWLAAATVSARHSSWSNQEGPSAPDLSIQRELIAEAKTALGAGDYAKARAIVAEVVTDLLARPESEQDVSWVGLLNNAGYVASDAQDARMARAAWEKVLEVNSRTLPDDHPDLQLARQNLGVTLWKLGDLAGARALQESVLDVRSRTLPDDHADLQRARQNLGVTLWRLGDLARARALFEKALQVNSRTLSDDHADLQQARQNVAGTIYALGDLAGARALFEKVLEVNSRTLPDDHPELQRARQNLAATIQDLGDLAGARALAEKVLEVDSRTLPDDHPDLQAARLNLAATLKTLGDFAAARVLEEKVLEVRSRNLPGDHPDLQAARESLAGTLWTLGDLAGARALVETVLEVRSRTLPDQNPDLQLTRQNLAVLLETLGDLAGARILQENVLEVSSRTLPNDHPFLQLARRNLAVTIRGVGDLAGARVLCEKALEVSSRNLPDDHPDLQAARLNLAATLIYELARQHSSHGEEEESIREPDGAKKRCAELLASSCHAQVHAARVAILASPAREAEERCSSLAEPLEMSLSFALGYGVFEAFSALDSPCFEYSETTRGAAIASAELTRKATGSAKYSGLRDALRATSDELAGLAQIGTTSEEFDHARVKRESVERDLVALARELLGGSAGGAEISVESLAERLSNEETAVSFRRYAKRGVSVGGELDSTGQPAVRETLVASLCAFVVRSSKAESKSPASRAGTSESSPTPLLSLIDLGPIEPIEQAARAWREGLGVSAEGRGVGAGVLAEATSNALAQGITLRERMFDPLLPALAGAPRVVIVLDDVLHLVPLDALPLAMTARDGTTNTEVVGDRWHIETRTTLTERLISREPIGEAGALVAFGDVDYGASELLQDGAATGTPGAVLPLAAHSVGPRRGERDAGDQGAPPTIVRGARILRGSAWAEGFSALPGTGREARGIARMFAEEFGDDAPLEVCEHANATRERLLGLAPKARSLHIATHGWYATESIRSWSDPEPLDKQSGLGSRPSGAEQVRGMSPMLLCGLALAGANLPEDAVGRAPGLITADELSTLDLSNCELVVLSACDTNVGVRRAGQGVASLQKALQMAGARSVITSLWKVPDEATKELMLDFYRRLWVEKKPKHQALWEAKRKLREAKDERGEPKYTTRDWAAWVLTGDPR